MLAGTGMVRLAVVFMRPVPLQWEQGVSMIVPWAWHRGQAL